MNGSLLLFNFLLILFCTRIAGIERALLIKQPTYTNYAQQKKQNDRIVF